MLSALLLPALLGAQPAPDAGLKSSMHSALQALLTLQPLVARPPAFRAPENRGEIDLALAALESLEHQFLPSGGPIPAAAEMSRLLARQAKDARRELAARREEEARLRTRGLSSLCLNCHLRESGPNDLVQLGARADELHLTPLERAHFLASVRQFDAALKLWKTALVAKPKNDVDAFDQAQALRVALDVAIRGKDDPQVAVALLSAQKGRPELPSFVSHQVDAWLKEAQAWQQEKLVAASKTPEELFKKAQELVSATGAEMNPTADEHNYVSLVRAAAYLKEALRREPSAPWRGEALYLSGVVAATANSPLLARLEWLYLEACARENAKKPLGARCVERLARRTYQDYSGQELPPDVARNLGELRALVRQGR